MAARVLRDNTMVLYVWSDNGSSAEGQNGSISEFLAQAGIATTTADHIKVLNELGGLAARREGRRHAPMAPEARTVQYFEIMGSRAIYKGTFLSASVAYLSYQASSRIW